MERRLLLAVLLISAVMVITNLLFPPPPAEQAQAPAADSAQVVAVPRAAPIVAPSVPPAATADTVTVSSSRYRYSFSTRGASLIRAELLDYPSYTHEGEPVQLAPLDAPEFLSLRLVVGADTVDLRNARFEPSAPALTVADGAGRQPLRFSFESPSGFGVQLTYTFDPDRYVIGVEGQLSGLAGQPATLLTELGPGLAPHEARDHHSERELAVVLRSDDDVDRLRLGKLEGAAMVEGPLTWLGLKDKYFVVAQIAGTERPFASAVATRLPDQNFLYVEGNDTIATQMPRARVVGALPVGADGAISYELYAGPQDFQEMAAAGYELEDVTQYAYAWLEPVIRPLAALILTILGFLHNSLNLAYGWVLVIFGVFMRIILWPLNAKAFRSQLKNMAVSPLMQEIREKYKDDPQKQQEELMRLYKEHGFNPMAGCLPMLLPFPVLITLFFVFQNTIAFRGAAFLWLPDLSLRDPFYILPFFLVASMFAMQWVTTQMSGVEQNPQMKMMMYVLPVMMGLFFFNMPAGLNLYYATTNVAGLPQQLMIARERRRAQEELAAQKAAERPSPVPTRSQGRKKRQTRG
ncbi:MAG TPA: membrane protein insertase YidC [Longimicrobiaceae bacterium]